MQKLEYLNQYTTYNTYLIHNRVSILYIIVIIRNSLPIYFLTKNAKDKKKVKQI